MHKQNEDEVEKNSEKEATIIELPRESHKIVKKTIHSTVKTKIWKKEELKGN